MCIVIICASNFTHYCKTLAIYLLSCLFLVSEICFLFNYNCQSDEVKQNRQRSSEYTGIGSKFGIVLFNQLFKTI